MQIETTDAAGMYARRDELLAVYREVYAAELADPFFSEPRYWERLESYAKREGFSLTLGRAEGELIGYALGCTLPATTIWWRGLRLEAPPGLTDEDGARTFALTEIMVRAQWRRQGHARALHDALLADRPEERATLLVEPDNNPARRAYVSWGWRSVGELQPYPDAPLYEAMLLQLS